MSWPWGKFILLISAMRELAELYACMGIAELQSLFNSCLHHFLLWYHKYFLYQSMKKSLTNFGCAKLTADFNGVIISTKCIRYNVWLYKALYYFIIQNEYLYNE